MSSVSARGTLARSGEALHLLELGVPHHRVAVAAEPRRGRLEEAQARVHRDRGVDRGAAALERLDRGHRRQRLRRSGRAVEAVDGRSRCEARTDRAVAGMDVGAEEAIGPRGLEARQCRGFGRGRTALTRSLKGLRQQRRCDRGGGDRGDELSAAHGRLPIPPRDCRAPLPAWQQSGAEGDPGQCLRGGP